MVSDISDISNYSNSHVNFNQSTSTDKIAKGVALVKKGEVGYVETMDLDEDGEVTLDEFNEYCSDNGINEQEKLSLLQSIQTAKTNQKITEKMKEKISIEQNDDNKIIYSKKGDKNYDSQMDLDDNGIVTYEEYIKYCEQKNQKKVSDLANSKHPETQKTDTEEISVDIKI